MSIASVGACALLRIGVHVVQCGLEHLLHLFEAHDGVMPVFPEVVADFAECDFLAEVGLRVEAVGVADNFLLQGAGTVVFDRQRKVLAYDLVDGDAASRMAFRYVCMTWQPFFAQEFGTKITMFYVLMRSCTEYLRGIAEDDADVVQHRCLLYETPVHQPLFYPFGVGVHDTQRTVTHLHGVGDQHMTEVGMGGVVLVYKCNVINQGIYDLQIYDFIIYVRFEPEGIYDLMIYDLRIYVRFGACGLCTILPYNG